MGPNGAQLAGANATLLSLSSLQWHNYQSAHSRPDLLHLRASCFVEIRRMCKCKTCVKPLQSCKVSGSKRSAARHSQSFPTLSAGELEGFKGIFHPNLDVACKSCIMPVAKWKHPTCALMAQESICAVKPTPVVLWLVVS